MKVLIIDDDQLVTISLATILGAQPDIEVIGTGNSGQEAIELYQQLRPDILLMDIRMGDMTGLEAAEKILESDQEATILFLTTFLDNEYIVRSLKIGARGYLLKQNFESIVPSLQAIQSGQSVFGDQIVDKLPELLQQQTSQKTSPIDLTQRESDILAQIAEGLSNKEIAAVLFLSEGTVRNYISNLLEKLELRDRTQLAIFYYKNLR